MRIREIFIVLVLIFSFLLPVSIVNAQTPEQRIEKLEQQVEKQDLLIDGYQKLLEESKNFREGVHQQVEEFYSEINCILAAIAIALVVFQIFIFLMFGQSRRELKAIIDEKQKEVDKMLEKMENEVKEKLEEQRNKLEDLIEKKYEDLLLKVLKDNKSVKAIKQIVRNELSYTNAKIGFISRSEEETKRLEKEETQLLQDFGVKEEILTFTFEKNREEIEKRIEQGEIDVLIYSCEKLESNKDKDNTLIDLVNLLKELNCRIPIIIYTYQRGSQVVAELEDIKGYFNYAFANFPATLLSNLLSLAYVFNRNTSQSRKTDGE